ncbi:MAG TPA: ABC transporter substrate-binding protein [Reyranella sp.]|jgi:branched-chain amino acid transport system substrate-binding protein|nr:ABC transporter substrate-binding protein [Reyranella sp.]
MMRYVQAAAAAAFACVLLSVSAVAQNNAVKIGVLDDMSGPYAENTGPGDVASVRFAIADFGGSVLGKPIELVTADFQSKVDVGVGIAKRWYDDENVDMILGIPNSAIALALVRIAQEKNRIVMPTAAATSELTGKACTGHSIHWIYDTYGQTKTIVNAISKMGGDNSWFFVTVDYAFGLAVENDATTFIKAAGGKVAGSVRHPLNTADFSSYLLQAQASKAQGLMFANGGNDIINGIKQAAEFGLAKQGMKISAPLAQFPDVKGVGLKVAQGLLISSPFYWDMTPEARAFTDRFTKVIGRPPSFIQAGTYGAVLHYLKAVQAAGTDEAKAVMAKMKELPINDFMTKNGQVREDGRVIRDMYLMQAKTPEESKSEWDLVKMVATVPGNEAFRPLNEGGCPLVGKKQ